jgi:hypothetical protein
MMVVWIGLVKMLLLMRWRRQELRIVGRRSRVLRRRMTQVLGLTLSLGPGPHELFHLFSQEVDRIEKPEDDYIGCFVWLIPLKILTRSLWINSRGH